MTNQPIMFARSPRPRPNSEVDLPSSGPTSHGRRETPLNDHRERASPLLFLQHHVVQVRRNNPTRRRSSKTPSEADYNKLEKKTKRSNVLIGHNKSVNGAKINRRSDGLWVVSNSKSGKLGENPLGAWERPAMENWRLSPPLGSWLSSVMNLFPVIRFSGWWRLFHPLLWLFYDCVDGLISIWGAVFFFCCCCCMICVTDRAFDRACTLWLSHGKKHFLMALATRLIPGGRRSFVINHSLFCLWWCSGRIFGF